MKKRYDVSHTDGTGCGFYSRDQRKAFEMAVKTAACDRFGESFMTQNTWDSDGRIIDVSTVIVKQDRSYRKI